VVRAPVGRRGGRASFFSVSVILVILWMPTVMLFSSFDTWQVVINTVTSVLAFVLIALLQNSERRSDRAASENLDILAAGVADVLALQTGGADPDAVARRIDDLRGAIRLEEQI
jgi:low affinity Fe/Cu permease